MGVLLRGCRAHTFLTKSYSTSLVSHPILNLKCELVFFFHFLIGVTISLVEANRTFTKIISIPLVE